VELGIIQQKEIEELGSGWIQSTPCPQSTGEVEGRTLENSSVVYQNGREMKRGKGKQWVGLSMVEGRTKVILRINHVV
jgi:hypothetical protein